MVGRRHYEVAKLLKDIPKGSVFTLRLIEPLKVGFCMLIKGINKLYVFKSKQINTEMFLFN